MPRLPRRTRPLLTVCTRCVPGALASLPTSSEVSKFFAHSTYLTNGVLCARLPPLIFFLASGCTRTPRICAVPLNLRRTADGWCDRFRDHSGLRLRHRRALRLAVRRPLGRTRGRCAAGVARMPVAARARAALARRSTPAACIAKALRRARRRPTCSWRLSPRHRVHARRHALSRRRPRRARRTADVRRAVASADR